MMRLILLSLLMAFVLASACVCAKDEGPRMDDKQFFSLLNLDHAGLAKVKAAVGAGDMNAAKHEFAEYLRHREKPVWNFDWRARPKHEKPPADAKLGDAERIMQRDLPSVGIYHKYDGEIDWTLNPINYKEWPWQLNRHPFWATLGRAYWATGDEKYAREFVYQMTDWVRKCPVPIDNDGNRSETWRTIEAGIRMAGSWPESFHLFLTSPSFADEAIVTMVKSMAEHAQHLMKWPTTANWLTMECNGLMHVGVLFPEFKDAAEWRKTATDRMYAELDKQVYPDGAQIELATGYHQVSLSNFLAAWEYAHLNGVEMPGDYVTKMQRMFDYNLNASMPNGCLPGLNDAGTTNIRGQLNRALKYFPERKDFRWVATAGKEGTKPETGSIALPFSGHMIMRSGWEPDDLYMLFDAGPFGYGHQHEDALSFVIYAYGKYMLIDPGNYPYDSSQWRKYVLSTRSHNTIMVDGQDQHRRGRPRTEYVLARPMPIKWASNAKFDYADSSYDDNYGEKNDIKVKHRRRVFFVKPEYWVVVDTLTPADDMSHKYWSMFHLDMSGAEIDAASKAIRTTDKEGANLTIVPMADDGLGVSIISGQEKPFVQGWVRAGNYDCRPIPTPVFEKSSSGKATMAYAFYPAQEGKQCPIEKVESIPVTGADGATGLAVRFAGDRVDYLVLCDSAGAEARFGKFTSTAQVTYISTEKGRVRNSAPLGEIQDLSKTTVRHKFQ